MATGEKTTEASAAVAAGIVADAHAKMPGSRRVELEGEQLVEYERGLAAARSRGLEAVLRYDREYFAGVLSASAAPEAVETPRWERVTEARAKFEAAGMSADQAEAYLDTGAFQALPIAVQRVVADAVDEMQSVSDPGPDPSEDVEEFQPTDWRSSTPGFVYEPDYEEEDPEWAA